jgi:hypothetical protein
MDFVTHSFRHAEAILSQPGYSVGLEDLRGAITDITDEHLIKSFDSHKTPAKSLSRDINNLLKRNLKMRGWEVESAIFQDSEFDDKRWRLDFAKDKISVEVAFNHAEAIAWNLLKPVLASELNHVKKAVQTEIGVVICATAELKRAGQFDSAVGEYEKFLRYLDPLQDVLTVPILLIGLKKPATFEIVGTKIGGRMLGRVRLLGDSA